jgi:hypothetical protein
VGGEREQCANEEGEEKWKEVTKMIESGAVCNEEGEEMSWKEGTKLIEYSLGGFPPPSCVTVSQSA